MKKVLVILSVVLFLTACSQKTNDNTTENKTPSTTVTLTDKKEAEAPKEIVKPIKTATKLAELDTKKQSKITKEIEVILEKHMQEVALTKTSLKNVIGNTFNEIQNTHKDIDFSDYKAEVLTNLEENISNIEKSSLK